jgi:hypothetical protein
LPPKQPDPWVSARRMRAHGGEWTGGFAAVMDKIGGGLIHNVVDLYNHGGFAVRGIHWEPALNGLEVP